ncbi:hypothetical protein P280DRAFT_190840 [Massarina eburnea CBS 473.64]|uniref:Uncharacterized protein n=1 Tax=Massarina eburnea CBS 473.64 TaxID=1395130 RepID=A0A6A6RN43_9PLEO|nr:hypothetical protein P280DRAFT_190840 [Massarina eburnea CBS 473.64]
MGFIDVPREGGAEGEMMWDHSKCEGNGHQSFCCPMNLIVQPRCTWRGYNDGRCNGRCEYDETEVGSLSVGCKKGHQKACCFGIEGIEAYSSCIWTSDTTHPNRNCAAAGEQARCTPSYSSFVFASSLGFGGEDKCLRGARSYCCHGNVPSEFHNCKWTYNYNEKGVCEQYCPFGHIKLGMLTIPECERRGGFAAYCCAGQPNPSPTPIPQRPTPSYYSYSGPPIPSSTVKPGPVWDFKLVLDHYIDNRGWSAAGCALEILPVIEYDFDFDDDTESLKARSEPKAADTMESIANVSTTATKESTCVRAFLAIGDFIMHLVDTQKGPTNQIEQDMSTVYDQDMGIYGKGVKIDSMRYYIHTHQNRNPRAIIDNMLRDPLGFSANAELEKNICRGLPQESAQVLGNALILNETISTPSQPASNSTESLHRRTIYNTVNVTPLMGYDYLRRPSLGDILVGVLAGHLSRGPSRFFWYGGNHGLNPAGPCLETVYWIGLVF